MGFGKFLGNVAPVAGAIIGGYFGGPAGAAAGAAAGGAISSAVGQREANKQNKAAAHEQMKFQQTMSDTSHRRAIQDMQLAGLNPMLAYTQGGAQSASGAAYSAENEAPDFANASSSAVDAYQKHLEKQRVEREAKQADSQISLNYANEKAAEKSAALAGETAKKVQEESQRARTENQILQQELKGAKVRGNFEEKYGEMKMKADAVMNLMKGGASTAKDLLDTVNPLRHLPDFKKRLP